MPSMIASPARYIPWRIRPRAWIRSDAISLAVSLAFGGAPKSNRARLKKTMKSVPLAALSLVDGKVVTHHLAG
jgi:hypothetical protein